MFQVYRWIRERQKARAKLKNGLTESDSDRGISSRASYREKDASPIRKADEAQVNPGFSLHLLHGLSLNFAGPAAKAGARHQYFPYHPTMSNPLRK